MIKIFRLLLVMTGVLWVSACSKPKDKVLIEGEITGIKQADFYVYNEEGLTSRVDTVRITNGQFSCEYPLTEPVLLTFLYPNFSRTFVIAEPGKELEVTGQASNLKGLDVSGSEENELMTKFKLQNIKNSSKDAQMAAAQFVRDHIKTMAAVAVFKKYFVQVEKHNAAIALPLLEELRKAQPHNSTLKALSYLLDSKMRTAEGNILPDFYATTIKGDSISRKNFAEKPLLVLFWAPWTSNNYKMLKTVSNLEKKYAEQLQILILSVDFDKKLTTIRVRQEGIKSPVVCEGRGFFSPLVQTLGVRYVPGNLLVNKDGEIYKRDVTFEGLEKEVEDWIK